ncbi:MAG: alpha-amylase [Hyphomicrobiales bacterium]|nr:alpha-amylase [Hyphomicrobiales bacterium]
MNQSDPPARAAARRARPAKPQRAEASTPSEEGRVIIENVAPEIDGGRAAAKGSEGATFKVSADIFSDGHEVLAADILWQPSGAGAWSRAPMHFVDNDRWSGHFVPLSVGRYLYSIEAWRDTFASWRRDTQKKLTAGVDVRVEIHEGLELVEAAQGSGLDADLLGELAQRLGAASSDEHAELLLSDEVAALMAGVGPRAAVSHRTPVLELVVDRRAALFSAWYEMFPRSQAGDPGRHGTFEDVIERLPYVRDLGFDVLYFPPIHPIGHTNRKGRNNALIAGPDDPGSVYAIGSEEGGHTAVHPQLGTIESFRKLVAAARAQEIEIALDIAVQCSPDHPWIKEHPEWFDWRPDGTIKFAENPPKKYEDIVNVHFEGKAFPEVWFALRDVIAFWADNGVRIFRVDNPHTKPIPFWRWLIREINAKYPDVIFLAEAFTRPKMMQKLAKIGFQQSYTYFTWRNTKSEIVTYMLELTGDMADYYRPNFFVNTPDINPYYLQTSGRPGFIVRSTLAATLSSVWGLYSGFEICEARAIPGREEYLDSEKYEIRADNMDRPGNIKQHIRALNHIRRSNAALQDFRGFLPLLSSNDQVLVYARHTPDWDNCIIVLINLDPYNRQGSQYEIPLWKFDLPDWAMVDVEDLLNGNRFQLHGKTHTIEIDPAHGPVAIWKLLPPSWRVNA